MSTDLSRLAEIVEAFARQRVVVWGDLVADQYVSGEIARVSREAPVLILRHRETQVVPGGAANAANNLADLGAQVVPVGVLGDDWAGGELLAYFERKGVRTQGIVRARGWRTPTKTRYLAGWPHTAHQQVLRVDHEPEAPLPKSLRDQVSARAQRLARQEAAVLVSDYGFGAVSPDGVRRLRAPLVTLDSRYQLLAYARAGVTAATPNEPELEALYSTRIAQDTARLEALGAKTLRRMGLRALLVTRGKDGMVLFERGRPAAQSLRAAGRRPLYIPIHGSAEARDVTGAGDTVIAVFTLGLAAGGTFAEAATLANYAGGIVVMKRGTATVTRDELLAAVRRELTESGPTPAR